MSDRFMTVTAGPMQHWGSPTHLPGQTASPDPAVKVYGSLKLSNLQDMVLSAWKKAKVWTYMFDRSA